MEEVHVLNAQGNLQLADLGARILPNQEFAALLTSVTEGWEVVLTQNRSC